MNEEGRSRGGATTSAAAARVIGKHSGWLCAVAATALTAVMAALVPAAADEFPQRLKLDKLSPDTGLVIRGQSFSSAGYNIGGAGDVNGDGRSDLVAGSPYMGGNFGGASVVFGAPRGSGRLDLADLDGTNGFLVTGLDTSGFFGDSAAGAGDVNGDGLADIVVGAPRAGKGDRRDAGEAFVVFGRSGGFPASFSAADLDGTNGFRILGAVKMGGIGGAVAGAGDVNGDGFDDFLIGGSNGDGLSEYAYLVFGKSEFPPVIDLAEIDGRNGVRFHSNGSNLTGISVAGAGDVDGDGFDDVLIGDPDTGYRYSDGAAYLIYGHAGKFPRQILLRKLDGRIGFAIAGSVGNYFGGAVAGGSDVNGDGLSDMVFGDSRAAVKRETGAGTFFVVFGRSERFPSPLLLNDMKPSEGIKLKGKDVFGWLGRSVALVPDIDGDGLAEVLAGAPEATEATRTGMSYLLKGSRRKFAWQMTVRDLDGANGFMIVGIERNDRQGSSVAGLGDFDGDGLGDFATGAPEANRDGVYHVGEIYVVYGRGSLAESGRKPQR